MMTNDWVWLLDTPWLALIGGISLCLLLGWLAGALQNRRRSQAILSALNDSARGRVIPVWGPGRRGFFSKFQPAPDPFTQFSITYHARSNLDLIGWLLRPLTGQRERMIIHGKLGAQLGAELIWLRGQIPARALGNDSGATLWRQQWLDFANCAYATRGANPGAIVHGFTDLQSRFGPWLHKVSIQADETPELEIVLRTTGLNVEEIRALITTVRAVGRAALLR